MAEAKISPVVVIGGGLLLGLGAALGIYALAQAAPPTPPPGEYCCPYNAGHVCFATYEELVAHVQSVHPGERVPLPIEWE